MARLMLFHGPGRPLEPVHLPDPTPGPGELLVRVSCCTLCASDLHTHAGRRHGSVPIVLGHEVVGRIEAFGPQTARTDLHGQSLAEGDRVIWSVFAGCGLCFFCAAGLPQKCEHLFKYGHHPFSPARPFSGGLADHVVLASGTTCLRVPDDLPNTLAAPAGCATATAAAVLRTAGLVRDRVVLIVGAGVLGLTAAAMLRSAGAGAVIVTEADSVRRARATAFGATHTCAPEALAATIAAATEGRGVDVALELAGTSAAVSACLEGVRVGGTVVLAGTVLPTAPVPLDPEQVVRRLLTLRGVHNYVPADLAEALTFLTRAGRNYPFADLIGSSFSLEDADTAFTHGQAHPGVRTVVVP